jgi:hypothetical protein
MTDSERNQFCVECGSPLPSDSIFCTECGTRRVESRNRPGEPTSETAPGPAVSAPAQGTPAPILPGFEVVHRTRAKWIALAIAVLVVPAGTVTALVLTRDRPGHTKTASAKHTALPASTTTSVSPTTSTTTTRTASPTTTAPRYVPFSTIVAAVQEDLEQGGLPGAGTIPDAEVTCPPVTVAPGAYFACDVQSQSLGNAAFLGQIVAPYPGAGYFRG